MRTCGVCCLLILQVCHSHNVDQDFCHDVSTLTFSQMCNARLLWDLFMLLVPLQEGMLMN